VSIIETALAKLRRPDAPGAAASVLTPRPAVAAAIAPQAPAAAIPPKPAYRLRHIATDLSALRTAGYLPEAGLERRFADHFRQIKRPLVDKALAGGADMRLILVSSALPGDGKTFTSINLALSIARERDVSVLLVDADAPKRRVSEIFGLRDERGLLDALGDSSVHVESLIVETDIPRLQVLPAGKFIESAPELFASARMDEIVARISECDPPRIAIFDSAPLLVSNEGRALLRIPGQVVLVVRSGVTPRQAIVDAAGLVDRKKLQGLILNQTVFKKGGGYDYYDHPGYEEEKGATPANH
jgi:protein-tyrosine kinase